MADLMESGSLVRYDAFAYDAPDLHDVKKAAETSIRRPWASRATRKSSWVTSWPSTSSTHTAVARSSSRSTSQHSESLVHRVPRRGIAAEHLDCFTPKRERERILAGLASGDVTVVSSVGVLTEGFDCPAAEVCILARPTMSLTLFMQMVGRVLRPNDGKIRALIHDHAGNLIRHGFPEDDRDYSLTATPKRDRELHTCPFCNVVFGALKPDGSCPNCGQLIQEVTERESAGRGTKVVVDGKRLTVDEIRAIREDRADKGMRTDLTDEQLVRVEHASKDARAAEFLRLRDVAIQKNFDRRWPDVQYRNTFGKWPRFDDEYLNTVKPAGAPFVPLPPRKVAA
jgi:superfamily II DNA or RNA helicase